MRTCIVHECEEQLTKPSHNLCRKHWRAERDGKLHTCDECGSVFDSRPAQCPGCDKGPSSGADEHLSSTKVGKHFQLSAQRINLVLAELGWIEKGPSNKGWVPTGQGERRKATARRARQTGIPYVVWPTHIVEDRVLLAGLEALRAPAPTDQTGEQPDSEPEFGSLRPSQPGTLRTTDGHLVRSRGEALIDNWLYMARIVHAYERRLPIEQEAYCDFWIPDGKVFIEYWGIEGKQEYEKRKQEKLAIYAAHELKLIEITNADIERIDDVLPPRLMKFGISSK